MPAALNPNPQMVQFRGTSDGVDTHGNVSRRLRGVVGRFAAPVPHCAICSLRV